MIAASASPPTANTDVALWLPPSRERAGAGEASAAASSCERCSRQYREVGASSSEMNDVQLGKAHIRRFRSTSGGIERAASEFQQSLGLPQETRNDSGVAAGPGPPAGAPPRRTSAAANDLPGLPGPEHPAQAETPTVGPVYPRGAVHTGGPHDDFAAATPETRSTKLRPSRALLHSRSPSPHGDRLRHAQT